MNARTDLMAWLPGTIEWSEPSDKTGSTITRHGGTWSNLIDRLRNSGTHASKDKCPWIKLATFGDRRSGSGSLRTNENVVSICGLEGDYDGEAVTIEQAAALLEQRQIRAALYPSPSSTKEKPRWRVICPTSRELPPTAREGLLGLLNGILGGILAAESFTLSQSYYFGGTSTNDYRVVTTEGSCIDLVPAFLLPQPIGKHGVDDDAGRPTDVPAKGVDPAITSTASTDATWDEITGALKYIKPDCSRKDWITVGMGLHSHGAQCDQIDQAFTVWDTWSAKGAKYPGQRAMAQQWHSFHDDKETAVTIGSLFKLARDEGWTRPQVDASGLFSATGEGGTDATEVNLTDFFAYMPTHQYIYAPTRDLWPAASVDGRMAGPTVNGKKIPPSRWLDQNRPVEQMVWDPNKDALIKGHVMQVSGYAKHEGATIFNLYRPPECKVGDRSQVGPWLDHLNRIYPDDADHIANYLAFKLQNPGIKINHAIVLGGGMGIGKDTLLEPIKAGVGPWNWQEISPAMMLGRFNGWAKCTVLRISEARDLGDVDRFAFYDHSKTFLAAPPDVIRVDEKNLREHYVANVCGVVITTNHKTDGLYLPADDRRHYVAWSTAKREEFAPEYWNDLYRWYTNGGIENVVAYLLGKDLAQFDPKAPPPKTAAFWAVVQAGEAPESGELRDVVDKMGSPAAFTLAQLAQAATTISMYDLATELRDRRGRRAIPHKLERVGFVPVRNPDANDGLFVVTGNRVTVYADQKLPLAEQIRAARAIS